VRTALAREVTIAFDHLHGFFSQPGLYLPAALDVGQNQVKLVTVFHIQGFIAIGGSCTHLDPVNRTGKDEALGLRNLYFAVS